MTQSGGKERESRKGKKEKKAANNFITPSRNIMAAEKERKKSKQTKNCARLHGKKAKWPASGDVSQQSSLTLHACRAEGNPICFKFSNEPGCST